MEFLSLTLLAALSDRKKKMTLQYVSAVLCSPLLLTRIFTKKRQTTESFEENIQCSISKPTCQFKNQIESVIKRVSGLIYLLRIAN